MGSDSVTHCGFGFTTLLIPQPAMSALFCVCLCLCMPFEPCGNADRAQTKTLKGQ